MEQPTKFNLVDQVMNELKNVMLMIETLKVELECLIEQRNQLEAENRDVKEKMEKDLANRDTEIGRLKNELQRQITEQRATADLLLNSFSQMQNIMNSVKQNMSLSGSKE